MRLACCALIAVVCLGLVPVEGRAATITYPAPGVVQFDGSLGQGAEVVLIPFAIDGPSLFTVEFTAGFFPVLMLFGPVIDGSLPVFMHLDSDYQALLEIQTLDTNSINLTDPFPLLDGPGAQYLLAIAQSPNFYNPFTGVFEGAGDPNFLSDYPGCDGFVDASGACGNGSFSGTFGLQTVPEPAAVTLLVLGAAATILRRRRVERPSTPAG